MAFKYDKSSESQANKNVAKPEPGRFISGWRNDFTVDVGRLSLDPAKMGRTMRQADAGDTEAMFEMFSAVEEDPHVYSVLSKRRRQLTSRTMQITPVDDSDRAQRSAELCNELIYGEGGERGVSNWDEALWDMTDAIGRAYSVAQLQWEFIDGLWRVSTINRWPQRDTLIGDPFVSGFDREEEIRILTRDNPARGEEVPLFQFICHKHRARSDSLNKAALLRVVSWYFLFKHFSVKDWTIFAERYGMPVRVGKYSKASNDQERLELVKAINDLGKDGGAVIPKDSEIEFVEARVSGSLPYPQLAQFCNGEISKAILGNTLTTEVGSSGGNRALGEVHERGEIDMTDDDGKRLAITIRQQLCRPLVKFNLGDNFPVPFVNFLAEEEQNLKERAERDKILIAEIGLPVSRQYLYETYEIPIPQDGEEVIEPRTTGEAIVESINSQTDPKTSQPTDEDADAIAARVELRNGVKKKSKDWVL